MEADLQRFYQIDYRDRWRTDEHDKPRLTLRRIVVLVRHLPTDSALARALNGETPWNREHVLLADVWSALTGKEHLALTAAKKAAGPSAKRLEALAAAKARARRRRARIESGEIT